MHCEGRLTQQVLTTEYHAVMLHDGGGHVGLGQGPPGGGAQGAQGALGGGTFDD